MKSQLDFALFGIGVPTINMVGFHCPQGFSLASILNIRGYTTFFETSKQVDIMEHTITMCTRYFHDREKESEPIEEK